MGNGDRFVSSVAGVGGVLLVALGLWAFGSPSSFYDQVALFPPYNRHLLHDVGAFQIGLGVTLLLAMRWRDALLVTLLGVGAGAAFHAAAHAMDRDLGGRLSDVFVLGILAALLLLAGLRQWTFLRAGQRSRHG
jgi:hypothetical protein